MASSSGTGDVRNTRLLNFFNEVLHGQRVLNSPRDGKLFIEAVCAQPDPAKCAHRLLSSQSGAGLSSLQFSVRFDTNPSFINDSGTLLLSYLQDKPLETINSGSVLVEILLAIVEPPFFWDAFTKTFRDGLLVPKAIKAYAWLLFQLVRLPDRKLSSTYLALAKCPEVLNPILDSPDGATRILGANLKHVLSLESPNLAGDTDTTPGGRHDNDFKDIRQIDIMPTGDELQSNERPFLRVANDYLEDPQTASSRLATHLDNLFRLLREDMLGDIREELQILRGAKPGRHKGLIVDGLRLAGLELGTEPYRQPWGIVLQCPHELPQLKSIEPGKRKAYLTSNRHILRNRNMACLLIDDRLIAFSTIRRDEEALAMTPAKIKVQLQENSNVALTLYKIKIATRIKLVQLDTAVFAFEPFLQRLQEIKQLPLVEEFLHWEEGMKVGGPKFKPFQVIRDLEKSSGKDLQHNLRTERAVILDESQMMSLLAGLSQRISLIQGPPGTGKSFIGALLTKILHDHTTVNILVICFTNHALDQFLEDLMDIGIAASSMVRLGGKFSDRTKPLTLREQKTGKLNHSQWDRIDTLKTKIREHEMRIRDVFRRYQHMSIQNRQLLDYLEFASEELPFFDAFFIQSNNEGSMTHVGKRGKAAGPFYLLDRWRDGHLDAGGFQKTQPKGSESIWAMSQELRQSALLRWQKAIIDDLAAEIRDAGKEFNAAQAEIGRIFADKDGSIIRSKRIVACTTNGAATYSSAIKSASPGVVLVEEAGEILEAHIITAIGAQTEQLILIGDHQQLRPKCSYGLSVERGDGFDLNRSLFERLVLKGFPHVTLLRQHRMRPEISSIVRHLTYPDLADADSTLQRSDLRGFRDNVIFVNHSIEEIEHKEHKGIRDPTSSSSKQNEFEAQMILKCVRYLAQQGYGSDKLVVLTPYLGQLKLLRERLATENDPILNDLDKFDLIRAGLLTDLSSKTSKPSLKISTIDNYQGEESDIVLISLTRSNRSYDIGFMAAPERLNVMLSRARDALIMIGNAETFIESRKGVVWRKFFDYLSERNHVYEGFPVKCEKHPKKIALLTTPENFQTSCPDGGCNEPCDVLLKCGVHKCPSSCHQLFDHSKIPCKVLLKQQCPKGHSQSYTCQFGVAPVACQKCEREVKEMQKKLLKAHEEQTRREERQQKHLREIARVGEEIEQFTQSMKDARLSKEQDLALAQKKKDLASIKELARKAAATSKLEESPAASAKVSHKHGQAMKQEVTPISASSTNTTENPNTASKEHLGTCLNQNDSPSKVEWQRQKDTENASNLAIDQIMDMIGLEAVKSQVLRIKAKIETSSRQGTDVKKERFGLVLLGNPGTGKTTIARHYSKVLTSLGALPGDGFVETTGSRLAHGGVAKVKKHLEGLENSEGGVYFIDEAYQLTEAHNYGGKAVLDFLLAEIENLTGRIVFVFAGYRKQMEKFFEHNPGFSSRIPYTLTFEDYTDTELLQMLQYQLGKYYKGSMNVEDGVDGLYMRIAVRRLGKGRGRDGFGNARALENLFAQIRERQSDRLAKQRRDGMKPNDLILNKEDLIGPDPSKAILKCSAWEKLQTLTGLASVKQSVRVMIDLIGSNYERELQEKPTVDVSLNRVFLGSPGTGKTTVGKLYGRILVDIGLLSNGEGKFSPERHPINSNFCVLVVVKNPADFIGSVIGQSESNTKAILASTVGKVLIIDEAYMLYSGGNGSGGSGTDIYKTAVIDTIVAEVQSVPGDDRCVILIGYEEQMLQLFQNVNPGLTRRFPLSEAFHFEDFNDIELHEILQLKLKSQGLGASEKAASVAIDILSRARNGLNFGNGGDVENLISKAKSNFQTRQSSLPLEKRSIDFVFEPQDFDSDFDRSSNAETNIQELFKDVIGCEAIIAKLEGFVQVARGMLARGINPRDQIPMNFIFKGPPGTGKTTTARKFGRVFYDLGFLSKIEVVECSATDLIGQYVGQTGPKTIQQLERGLGKVLFIDEAYRLGEGHFAQEAINELVDTMTKPKFAGKLVIILAGYDRDMNNLMRVNEGLSSRFADEIIFSALSPEHCLQLLREKLTRIGIGTPEFDDLVNHQQLLNLMRGLCNLDSWGNARDVQTLAKSMGRTVFRLVRNETDPLVLSNKDALACLQTMLSERRHRASAVSVPPECRTEPAMTQTLENLPKYSSARTETLTADPAEVQGEVQGEDGHPELPSEASLQVLNDSRDNGVSDATWAQLEKDKEASELEARLRERQVHEAEEASRAAEEAERESAALVAALEEIRARDESEAIKLLEEREKARIRELEAQALREKMRQELERRQLEEMQRRKKEAQVQTRLREMGVCVAGFRWIKQGGGYRCAGGSHFVSDGQLGI